VQPDVASRISQLMVEEILADAMGNDGGRPSSISSRSYSTRQTAMARVRWGASQAWDVQAALGEYTKAARRYESALNCMKTARTLLE